MRWPPWRFVVHDPGGELLPVAQHRQQHLLRGPVEEHLAGAGGLTAGAAAQDHPVELGLLPGPGAGGAGLHALAAAHAAAGVLVDLPRLRVEGEDPGGPVLAGPDTGAAADAPLGVVGHPGHPDDAEVAQVGLIAVVGTAGDVDLDVVVAGEDDGLDLPGQLEGVAVAADAVVDRSIISEGTEVYGEVHNSVIGAGVIIKKGAVIRDSIIMKQSVIGENDVIDKAIIAENVTVGDNVVMGIGEEVPNKLKPNVYSFGLVTVGENTVIPSDVKIGKNTAIVGETTPEDYPGGVLESGETLNKEGETE